MLAHNENLHFAQAKTMSLMPVTQHLKPDAQRLTPKA